MYFIENIFEVYPLYRQGSYRKYDLSSGGSRGGARGAPPLFWVKNEEMTEGKMADRASKSRPPPPPPPPLAQGLDPPVLSLARGNLGSNGLFTWRESAPANRATRLEGSENGPPLHATHLTGTVSKLRHGLSFERPLAATNKMADQKNFLAAGTIFFIELFLVYKTVVNGNYEKKFTLHRHVFAVSSASRDSPAGTANLVKS